MPKKKVTRKRTPVINEAYVLGDGKVVSKSFLNRFEIKKAESKKLMKDPFDYRKGALVTPLYPLNELAQLLEVNTDHYRCVQAKAMDTAGLGWYLKPLTEKPNEKNKKILTEAFQNCGDGMTFGEVLQNIMKDYEGIGMGYLEIGRDGKNPPSFFGHIPAPTIRARKDKKGFVQIRSGKKVYFKNFGDEDEIDKKTGLKKEGLDDEQRANEIIQFRNYTSRSDYYGLPDIIPALGAVAGQKSARDYNIQFFENNAIPQYFITITGARLSETVKEAIKTFFKDELKGQAHKSIILPIKDKEVKVEFEKLAVGIRDASFRLYRQDNRDEIFRAEGVPPAIGGIIETGNIGAGSGLSQAQTYKNRIIEPRQTMMEARIDDIIKSKRGFEIADWEFAFIDLDLSDMEQESKIADRLVERGIISPNEARAKILSIDLPNMVGGDRAFVMAGNMPYFIDEMGEVPKEKAKKEDIKPIEELSGKIDEILHPKKKHWWQKNED